jgi:hypothetical protein
MCTTRLEDREMRRPEVLFFGSNESMPDLTGMKPQVTEAFGGSEDLMALWFSSRFARPRCRVRRNTDP